jgi:hypothetical protein
MFNLLSQFIRKKTLIKTTKINTNFILRTEEVYLMIEHVTSDKMSDK